MGSETVSMQFCAFTSLPAKHLDLTKQSAPTLLCKRDHLLPLYHLFRLLKQPKRFHECTSLIKLRTFLKRPPQDGNHHCSTGEHVNAFADPF